MNKKNPPELTPDEEQLLQQTVDAALEQMREESQDRRGVDGNLISKESPTGL